MTVVGLQGVSKRYGAGPTRVEALTGVDLDIVAGEFVAVVGPSGCGKSTLLHLCGAMDRATGGTVRFEGVDVATLDDDRLTRLRRERIGFVFQSFNLLPTLTVAENIALPLMLAGRPARESDRVARDLAARVGLDLRVGHRPAQLSAGEMQRTAIARAIVHHTALLVADEPTGNLASENGARILGILAELHRRDGLTVVLATHDREVAAAADRVITMRDGRGASSQRR